jgi:hypothetical protein
MMKVPLFGIGLVLVATLLMGCSGQPTPAAGNKDKSSAGHDAHDHGEPPHGGTLVEWGAGEYHPEFTVDHDQQRATVYILGRAARTDAPIAATSLLLTLESPAVQIELTAEPQARDPAGKSSRFVATHEALANVQEFSGTISGVVGETPYSGDFKEKPHGHDH